MERVVRQLAVAGEASRAANSVASTAARVATSLGFFAPERWESGDQVTHEIVTAYLEFAELQALNRKPMYMADWIAKLDDFLQLSEREILRHAGRISHEEAAAKAELEYDRFASERAALPAPVEKHFEAAVRDVKHLEAVRRAPKARKPPASTRKKP